jgi:hypothetical protein
MQSAGANRKNARNVLTSGGHDRLPDATAVGARNQFSDLKFELQRKGGRA